MLVQGKVHHLADATAGGVAGAVACTASGVGSAEVRAVHWCGSVDDGFFAVGVGEVRGPRGVENAVRLRARMEGDQARERLPEGTGGQQYICVHGYVTVIPDYVRGFCV